MQWYDGAGRASGKESKAAGQVQQRKLCHRNCKCTAVYERSLTEVAGSGPINDLDRHHAAVEAINNHVLKLEVPVEDILPMHVVDTLQAWQVQ